MANVQCAWLMSMANMQRVLTVNEDKYYIMGPYISTHDGFTLNILDN